MRTLLLIFLFNGIIGGAPALAGNNGGPVFRASGTTEDGEAFTSTSAYVKGEDAKNAAQAALQALEEANGEKTLVVSADDLDNSTLKNLEPEINKFPNTPRFLFVDGGSKFPGEENIDYVTKRTKQTYQVLKQDPGGIFFFLVTTAMSAHLYMHFVQHPNLFSTGVPILLTAIGNALFIKPSILFPLDNLKSKIHTIKTVTKNKENKLGEILGIDTDTLAFHDFQDTSVAVGGYTSATVFFENVTHKIPGGWRILAFQGEALRDGIFSGLSNSSFALAVRRWQRAKNPPLTAAGIDWFIRSQRFALAFFLPHLYAAKDLTGFVGVATVGAVGWLAFWKGEEIIPLVMGNPFVKNAAQLFSDLYSSFRDEYYNETKLQLKVKANQCSSWLSSLRGKL